jgi:dihydroorotase-like cyclic amidohydrolase
MPDPALLPTKNSQLSALRTLRSAASLAHRDLTDEIRTTNRLIQFSMQRDSRINVTHVTTPESTPPLRPQPSHPLPKTPCGLPPGIYPPGNFLRH